MKKVIRLSESEFKQIIENVMKNSNLENQNNIVKAELTKLYEMMITKVEKMEKINAPRPDVRRVAEQLMILKSLLENYFDFYNSDRNKEIEVACKIGDRYE